MRITDAPELARLMVKLERASRWPMSPDEYGAYRRATLRTISEFRTQMTVIGGNRRGDATGVDWLDEEMAAISNYIAQMQMDMCIMRVSRAAYQP